MRIRAIVTAGLLAAGLLPLLATPASAHEDRVVGDFEMTVGFATEPAFAGQPNGVEMVLSEHHEAVTDLADELEVTVTFGDQTSEAMPLEAAFEVGEFGTPGDYRADFVPSQPGTYTFRVTGTFHGQDFDEEFTSGPRTFGDVEDVNAASFPQVTAPSNQELATRIDQEAARGADAANTASAAASAAQDDAAGARTIGLAGVVIGALGLIVAVVAVASSRKTRG